MKKLLSVILVIGILLTTSITAFAAEIPRAEDVKKQLNGAAEYLTKDTKSFGVDNAIDFCLMADSAADMTKFEKDFLKDVKANLDANNGKIISVYGENLASYSAVIIALNALLEDPSDFYGYDIEKAFLAMDPTVVPATPNYYRYIARAAFYCSHDNSEQFLKKALDTYIENFYTKGKGIDYFGFSCDNTAYFVDALSYLSDEYNDILADTINVIESYKVKGGYCFNPEYGKEPNTNSTALALLAHCSYAHGLDAIEREEDYASFLNNHFDKVNSIYKELCVFESSSAGVFTYDNEASPYATKDAFAALDLYYYELLMQEALAEEEPSTEDDYTAKEDDISAHETTAVKANTTTQKTASVKKSPATGINETGFSVSIALIAATGVFAVIKKKENN